MSIETPKEFKACGSIEKCNHQVNYDMQARDNFYYQQGRADVIDEIHKYTCQNIHFLNAVEQSKFISFLVKLGEKNE